MEFELVRGTSGVDANSIIPRDDATAPGIIRFSPHPKPAGT
jgi:hypothetical protein